MILRAAGMKAGASTEALVEFVDVYPTLAELCGLKVPAHCEGLSMVPLLHDPRRKWKDAAYSQYPRPKNQMGYTIRSGQWRYTEWLDRETRAVSACELYDHSAGPLADRNLAGDPRHAETARRLAALLDKGNGWRKVRDRLKV